MAKIQKWNEEKAKKILKTYADNHNRYVKKMEKQWSINEATYLSKFYREFNNETLVLGEAEKENSWQCRESGNHTFSFVRLLHSKLISNPPAVASYPLSDDQVDKDSAKAADKIARHQRKFLHVDDVDSKVCLSTFIYGTGIKKVGWNPDSGRVIEKKKDELLMEGNVKLMEVGIRNFYFDQQADCWEEVKWATQKILMKKEEAENRYPKHKDKFKTNKEISTYSVKTQATEKNKDMVEIYEYYEKKLPENGMEGRFVVFTSSIDILSMGALPYDHGMLPFEIMTDIDVPQSVWGKSIIEVLQDPQDTYNRILSQIVENINTHCVIHIAAPKESGISEDSYNNKATEVYEYNGQGGGPPTQLTPAGLPGHVFKYLEMLVNIMEHLAGIRQISRGTAPKVLSGFAMQFLQEQDEKVLLQLHNKWKRYHVNSYRQILFLVQQYWKEERQLTLLGNDNKPEMYAFNEADLEGRFDVDYEYGTNLPSDPSAKRQAIIELIDKGLIEDKKLALRLLELGEAEGMYDTAKKAKSIQKLELENLKKGQEEEIFEREDHEAHLEVLYEYIQTNEYKYELESEIRQLVDAHTQAHEDIMKGAQAGQAGPQAPPPAEVPPEGMPPEGGGMPPVGGVPPMGPMGPPAT